MRGALATGNLRVIWALTWILSPGVKTRYGKSLSRLVWRHAAWKSYLNPMSGNHWENRNPYYLCGIIDLPPVTGLKAPESRARVEGLDEELSCIAVNSTGRLLCSTCTGRGWVICPDCKGRTKIRCTTCRGRGYVADWSDAKKKPYFQRQAEGLTNAVNAKVADVFEGIREKGMPIPNPMDVDPASKGRTVPCPDCVNGEVECTCGTGKRVCTNCKGAKTELCVHCGGTGKVVRHYQIVRRFDLREQKQIVGANVIPEQRLAKATGDLVYNAEINEPLYADAPPEGSPLKSGAWLSNYRMMPAKSRKTQELARAVVKVPKHEPACR